jgi:hypothetical protein
MTNQPIPGTLPGKVSDLRPGDSAALTSGCGSLVRVTHTAPRGAWGVRVTWDHGPHTKQTTRVLPAGNPIQFSRE